MNYTVAHFMSDQLLHIYMWLYTITPVHVALHCCALTHGIALLHGYMWHYMLRRYMWPHTHTL